MSGPEFQYVPGVHIPCGESADSVRARWESFPHGSMDRFCTTADRRPAALARVQHPAAGGIVATTVHPNLLNPVWFGDGRNAGQPLTRPGIFLNEIGESA
jgi:hypothetical protein